MKRFRYGLEPVLKYRAHQEQARQLELAEAQTEAARQQQALAELDGQQRVVEQRLSQAGTGAVNPSVIMHLLRDLEGVGRAVQAQSAQVAGCEETVRERRADLLAAVQERKKLERHREQGEERHRAEVARVEALAADDLTSTRHAHRLQGNDGRATPC